MIPTRPVFVCLLVLPGLAVGAPGGSGTSKNGFQITKIHEQKGSVPLKGLAFSADGKTLATYTPPTVQDFKVSNNAMIRIWDLTKKKVISRIAIKFGGTQMALSAKGKRLATNVRGGIQIYDARTGKALRTLKTPRQLGAFQLQTHGMQFNPASGRLVATYDDNPRIWVLKTGRNAVVKRKLAGAKKGSVGDVYFTLKKNRLFIVERQLGKVKRMVRMRTFWMPQGGVTVWNTKTSKLIGTFELEGFGAGQLAVSEDGETIVGLEHPATLRVWNLTKALAIKTPKRMTIQPSKTISLSDDLRAVGGSLALTPDGKIAAVEIVSFGRRSRNVRFLDLASGKTLKKMEFPATEDGSIAFGPNGRLFVRASSIGFVAQKQGKLTIWRVGGSSPESQVSPGEK